MRVLIAEDDAALSVFLKKGLELDGYDVDFAHDGNKTLESALTNPPDLLILDLNLPGIDGIQVLKALQKVTPPIATLILTGRSSVEDRVSCLDLGADDYLQKPFFLHELLARCRAVQRRKRTAASTVIAHGDLYLDRLSRTVKRSDTAIELTVKEHAMLDYFLQHRGRIIDRAELLVEVFRLVPETQTNVVDVYISYLRTKLKVNPNSPPLIETVRGQGYTIRLLEDLPGAKRPVQSVGLAPMAKTRSGDE